MLRSHVHELSTFKLQNSLIEIMDTENERKSPTGNEV